MMDRGKGQQTETKTQTINTPYEREEGSRDASPFSSLSIVLSFSFISRSCVAVCEGDYRTNGQGSTLMKSPDEEAALFPIDRSATAISIFMGAQMHRQGNFMADLLISVEGISQ